LRTPEERQQRLRGIPTAYNYRLEAPVRDLKSQADASESYPEELKAFVDNYEPIEKGTGLEAPVRNLKSQADASESYPEELKAFVDNYEPLKTARTLLNDLPGAITITDEYCYLCLHLSNEHPSPASANLEFGASLIKYLRKEIGQVDILPKRPLFDQDFQHILDCQRLETPAALQRRNSETAKREMYLGVSHEKPDAANRQHKREAFRLSPVEAWQTKDFTVKDGVAEWPLFCKVDLSTRKLNLSTTLQNEQVTTEEMRNHFHTSVLKAQFNTKEISHRSYRPHAHHVILATCFTNPDSKSAVNGFATRFVLSSAIENGGNFTDNQIDQLRRLGPQDRQLSTCITKKILKNTLTWPLFSIQD
ncbi:unnamed protein product, partial [Porites evermanni]